MKILQSLYVDLGKEMRKMSLLFVALFAMLLPLHGYAEETFNVGYSDTTTGLQLAVGPTTKSSSSRSVKKSTREVETAAIQYKPFNQVPVSMNVPSSVRVNKPFIAVFRFRSPVQGFDRSQINVSKGKITYFAGNSYSTIFRALILAEPGLDATNDPFVELSVWGSSGNTLKRVKVLPAPVKKTNPSDSFKLVKLEPHGYANIVVSRGGDSVDESSSYNIGDTEGLQVGFSYPVPETKTSLDAVIPRGSIRLMLGFEQLEAGSKGKNYTKFTTTTADLLYDIKFTESFNILAGGTAGFNGKLEAETLRLRDLPGSRKGTVEFENSFGFKFLCEYIAMETETVDFYINGGFSVIDYIPSKVILEEGSTTLSSPTRVGASSIKINFGLRI